MGDAERLDMTRTLLLSALITTLASGCALRGEYRGVAYVVDGTMVAAGAALVLAPEPDEWEQDDSSTGGSDGSGAAGGLAVVPFYAMHEVGGAMIVAGLVGAIINYERNVDYVTPTEAGERAAAFADTDLPPLPIVPAANPEAVRMTKQARRSALAGQCQGVRGLAPRVRAADPIYSREVMAQDPPIQACL